jgi:hypothetical protein
MSYWPFWAGGLALAGVALAHWFSLGRLMAVSGRFTALVNRVRFGAPEPEPQLSEEALVAAMLAATQDAFGEAAAPAPAPVEPSPAARPRRPVSASRQPLWMHGVFFASLTLGGVLAGALSDSLGAGVFRGDAFHHLFGSGASAFLPLVGGGFLVGFGTRMAGGCTSGHGLCGVSRVQTGSLLATCAFFGAGIGASFLLEALR